MSAIEERVIEKIRERADRGLGKYGVTMERQDLDITEWVEHAQMEAMDLSIYLERILVEINSSGK